MLGLQSARKFIRRNCYILVVPLTLWIWGCASTGPQPQQKPWTCDPDADAAVERQDWEQALLRHETLLRKEPGNCLAVYHLGYIQGRLGNRTDEAALYEQAVKCGLDQDDSLFFNLGMAYGDMSALQKALEAFERAVALNPDNAENYFGLAMTAQAAGDTPKALEALNRAVAVNPESWESRVLLVRIYLDQGRLEDARIHLEALKNGKAQNDEVEDLWQIYEDRRVTSYDR